MDKTEIIKAEAQALLEKMIDKFDLEVSRDEEVFHVVIKTEEEAPTVIGRHGETIRALQKILEVIIYKKTNEPANVLVNVNDYREKQKERLQAIATEKAEEARQSDAPVYFRGLSSFERRMIHEFVTASYPDLTTYSVGEGRDRRLVIEKKKAETAGQTGE